MTDLRIVVNADPDATPFDEAGTPILVWHDYYPDVRGQGGPGWVLYYPDDAHWIGGGLNDVEWAAEQAREHLRRRNDG
jgi:hypothetical protein